MYRDTLYSNSRGHVYVLGIQAVSNVHIIVRVTSHAVCVCVCVCVCVGERERGENNTMTSFQQHTAKLEDICSASLQLTRRDPAAFSAAYSYLAGTRHHIPWTTTDLLQRCIHQRKLRLSQAPRGTDSAKWLLDDLSQSGTIVTDKARSETSVEAFRAD